MNTLFERISLQAHLRRILDQYPDQAWMIIQQAIEREVKHEITIIERHEQTSSK